MGIYTIQDSNLILGGNGRGGEVRGYKGSNPFAMKYGYLEIRAKFADAGSNKGFVNQLWLIQVSSQTYDKYEIDLTETPTGPIDNNESNYSGINKINTSYHYNNYSGYRHKRYNSGVNLSQNFHLFAVEWTTNYIAHYFDNIEYYRVSDAPISNLDMYIILGLCAKCKDEEAAGCWSSDGCASGDARLYIDYVRVYDQKPDGIETCSSPIVKLDIISDIISDEKYSCVYFNPYAGYQCIKDPNGPYNSLAECENTCDANYEAQTPCRNVLFLMNEEIIQLKIQYEESWNIKDGRQRNIIQAHIRDRLAELGYIMK